MRRKAVGLLLLALIVVAGIVFVEYGTKGSSKGPAADGTSPMRVVLGGEPEAPVEPHAKALERPSMPLATDPVVPPAASPTPGGSSSGAAGGATEPSSYEYTVRGGDTLSRIAWEHLGTSSKDAIQRIVAANGLASPDRIRPGDTLIVPIASSHQVVANGSETLADIAAREYGNASATLALRRANPGLPAADQAILARGTRLWIPR